MPHRVPLHAHADRSGAVQLLRQLAREGTLTAAAAGVPATDRRLRAAAYDLAWPIVFRRLTRRIELRRGHARCAVSVRRMPDECLDRFHDDVEAVVADTLAHARVPIHNLEAWITSRLTAATVDGHRRRRGARGALQRPRIPGWLAEDIGDDRWLRTLAVEVLGWVGVTATAGTGVWPLDAWAQQRAAVTGDWQGSRPAVVEREVAQVLDAMRRRPAWYDRYVERPLGRKQAPVLPAVPGRDATGELPPLVLGEHDGPDRLLHELAEEAVESIDRRLRRGDDPAAAVVDVVGAVFGCGDAGEGYDRPPHEGTDTREQVTALLADPRVVERIVATVLAIVADRR
jgi:hypothetical protein